MFVFDIKEWERIHSAKKFTRRRAVTAIKILFALVLL